MASDQEFATIRDCPGRSTGWDWDRQAEVRRALATGAYSEGIAAAIDDPDLAV